MPSPTPNTNPSLTTEFVCSHCGIPFRVYTSQIPAKPRKAVYCSNDCKSAAQIKHAATEDDIARFWAKVDRSGGPDACWMWQAALTTTGYGKVAWPGYKGPQFAHRIAFEITNGRPPAGLIRHSCDTPRCVNPRHLSEGTQTENMREAADRDRTAHGRRNGRAILSEAQVRDIRNRYIPRHPAHGQAALGREFGVSAPTIHLIVHGKNWRRVKTKP